MSIGWDYSQPSLRFREGHVTQVNHSKFSSGVGFFFLMLEVFLFCSVFHLPYGRICSWGRPNNNPKDT